MIDNIIKAATCRVSCGNESGTGHLITAFHVLTARHCIIPAIESGSAVNLTFSGSDGDISVLATLIAHSENLDACILSIPEPLLGRQPIPLNASMPREGDDWRSFGYPIGKTTVGHRIAGTISHCLDVPKCKIDIDIAVDLDTALHDYKGLSGSPLVSENSSRGLIRLKLNGSLGAISVKQLQEFFKENGVQVPESSAVELDSAVPRKRLADRSVFQETFEQMIASNPGDFVFLEGAHGIGKTTFCSEFEPEDRSLFTLGTYSLVSQDRGPGAIYRAQPEVFFDWLSTAVSTLITGKASRKEERSYATLVRETSALLEAFSDYCASTQRHGILFLDGLNEAHAADPGALVKLVGLLPQSLPKTVTIVLTAPNYHSVAVSLTGRVKNQNVISLPTLSDESSSIYCWQELAEHRANAALVAQICEKAQGHPLYLRYLIEYANSSSEEDTLDDFPILTGTIEHYYESLWPRLLEDAHAINLLAIMARLRWGIGISDLPKILTLAEQSAFITTINRIRHLLLNPGTTTIYHPSFAEFLISKTADLEAVIQKQLADFCVRESRLEYCVLNVVFHLLHSDDADRCRAVVTCNQDWVDACVALGAEPDILLFDIETTLAAAVNLGPSVEVVRLLLLSQRVSFRYNTLFAQSARLIAEALIALKRPREALRHAIRFNTLIVDPDEALQIAHRLIQNKYPEEALELLGLLHQRILEAYTSDEIELQDFIHICKLHQRTVLFMSLADGQERMHQATNILRHAAGVFKVVLSEAPAELLQRYLVRIECVLTSYYLCFHDKYPSLARLKKMVPHAPSDSFLLQIIWTLFESESQLENYNLPRKIASLPLVFSDIEELVMADANFDRQFVPEVVDSLIQLGAPSSIVHLVADKGEKLVPQPIQITAENRVDVDFRSIHRGAIEWRTSAFLDREFDCPLVGIFDETSWLSALDQLIRALSWCEGKARRAKADEDGPLQQQSLEFLKTRVLRPLVFSLTQRVQWQDSYAIPEQVFPFFYGQVTLVLMDCYPKELPAFLSDLSERAADQWGLYTEGFRKGMFAVLEKLTILEIDPEILDEVFGLLKQWKDHVIHGVENRHELVPELLKLIPLLVKIGANEEADSLYRYMLSVSMGPSWYKEDQLGLMVSTLRKMPPSDSVQAALPLVAGYLERASGEMTFQRFVRYEKMALIGELFRRRSFVSGCRYFMRQTCGTTTELLSESQHGVIDKPSPMVGMRYPGGALDEQHAILEMVRNAEGIDWRLRWALLEIFQCGDERHIDDYATEYAKLINQAGIDKKVISEMVSRVEFVIGAEIAPKQRTRFLKSFSKELNTAHYHAFSSVINQVSIEDSLHEMNELVEDVAGSVSFSQDDDSQIEDKLYFPGIFGRQSAIRKADTALAIAEKHLKLRNLQAAKSQAVNVLQILQDGGWSIWGNLLGSTPRAAEELLRQYADSPLDLIRSYAPLLAAERHNPKWKLAEHLIEKVADLLSEHERSLLLQYVIDHIRLMVGDATNEIAMFSVLSEDPPCNASVELFRFVLWLLDHPQWLRRDKTAGMVAWLVESEPVYFEEAVKEAFSMATGYRPDILCGVLDGMSARQPQALWDRLFTLLDIEGILRNCRHIGRLAVLHRITERAGKAGSSRGAEVASRLAEQFRSGKIELVDSDTYVDLPSWASCVKSEWETLDRLNLATKELGSRLEEKMSEICAPLSIQENWNLENAVSKSFRETENRPLNRWEAKVRFALNTALFPYASQRDFIKIESAFRIFNPSLPECTLIPGFASPADAVLKAISSEKDYSGAIGDEEFFFLDYQEMTERGKNGNMVYIEVLAVIVPFLSVKGRFFLPSLKKSFRSNELPNFSSVTTYHETCWHLKPDFAFFGSFTPGFPLPVFKELIKAKDNDFFRVNWRNGKSDEVYSCGRPVQEGCLLAVKRSAIQLPEDQKLAWILRVNKKIVTIVDSQNNKLI